MTVLYILAAIAVFLFLAAISRYGATAEYSENDLTVTVRAAFLRIKVFPPGDKEKKPKKEKKKVPKPKEAEEQKKGGKLSRFMDYIPAAAEALGIFRRKLRVNELTLWYSMPGLDDAASAAINYGRMSAGCGTVISALENLFDIRKRDIRTAVDFTSTETRVYAKLTITIALWQIVYIAIRFLVKLSNTKNERKVDK